MSGEVMEILRSMAPFLAGLSSAFFIYVVVSQLSVELTKARGSMARRLERFAGVEEEPSWIDRLGDRLLQLSGLDPANWKLHLRWAKVGGYFPERTVGGVVGNAALYGLIGAVYALVVGVPFLWLTVPVLIAFPFIRVRSKSNEVKRYVRRALPELATLVAAEMAAGNAADQALARASEVAGPLGHLLSRAVAKSRTAGRPLFSRGRDVKGVIVESLSAMKMPELMAFASQLDLVASKGAAGPELMGNIARGLAREHRMRVLRAAEELESNLVIPATLFFFLPFVAAVMIPLFIPLLESF